MVEYIIQCNSRDDADELSRKMCDEDFAKSKIERDGITTHFLPIYENILTAQYGLKLVSKFSSRVDKKYRRNLSVCTPLWIDEKLINGDSFFSIGGQSVFSIINPIENRKILEGNFSSKILQEARDTTRQYTIQVQNQAQQLIDEYLKRPLNREKLLETIDPHLFEEFIAEVLSDLGFDIFLSPRTRDGGKDIIAAYTIDTKPLVMMVDCKRRKIESTLQHAEVSSLIGHYAYESKISTGIDHAMLVTTAGKFGPSSIKMAESFGNISLVNYEKLNNWLSKYGLVKKGLWMPQAFNDII